MKNQARKSSKPEINLLPVQLPVFKSAVILYRIVFKILNFYSLLILHLYFESRSMTHRLRVMVYESWTMSHGVCVWSMTHRLRVI